MHVFRQIEGWLKHIRCINIFGFGSILTVNNDEMRMQWAGWIRISMSSSKYTKESWIVMIHMRASMATVWLPYKIDSSRHISRGANHSTSTFQTNNHKFIKEKNNAKSSTFSNWNRDWDYNHKCVSALINWNLYWVCRRQQLVYKSEWLNHTIWIFVVVVVALIHIINVFNVCNLQCIRILSIYL